MPVSPGIQRDGREKIGNNIWHELCYDPWHIPIPDSLFRDGIQPRDASPVCGNRRASHEKERIAGEMPKERFGGYGARRGTEVAVMIVFRIAMNVIPEKRLEIMQTLWPMIEPTAMRPGCLGFRVFCDIEDENRFSLLGEWETREALDHHIASHPFSVLLGTKGLLCEPLDIRIYTVSHSEGMEAVHSLRDRNKKKNP